MSSAIRRDTIAGGVAGFFGGLISGWAIQAQGLVGAVAGFIGLGPSSLGFAIHLAVSTLAGAGFGAIFRYQPVGFAATVTGGVVYGLVWWIVGPLTLVPLLTARAPTWSIQAASAALPNLVGHLVYGAVVGLSFHILVSQYLRFRPQPQPASAAVQVPTTRVVILGGGFGGVSTAQRLDQLFARDPRVDITLISQSNYLLFTPMLAEVASSGLEAQHISAPVRAALPHVRFRHAEVEAIDSSAQVVRIRSGAAAPVETLPYDNLVLALGSVPNFYGLPGLEDHAFTLKTLHDATQLRNHVIALLEQADVERDTTARRQLLTFVVAGGGFAGTEMIAELFDLVHSVLRYYPNVRSDEPRFVLVHSGERILPEISQPLADYALRKLQARGIEFVLQTRVAGAISDAVLLTDGSRVPTRTIVWTAGNQPHPLLQTLPCQRNRAGAVIADEYLRVQGPVNVWAVGDCAEISDAYTRKPFPPTAQHALRQGRVVAENVAAVIRGNTPRTFRFRSLGMLVALGHRTAVAEVRGWKFSGFLAWFIWRTVYLSRLPGLEKKVRVALDWMLDLFFPRDIAVTQAATPTLSQTFERRTEVGSPALAREAPVEGER